MATATLPELSALKVPSVQSPGVVEGTIDKRQIKIKGLKRREVYGTLSSPPTRTDDPLRILAPAQKKLSTIESQRIVGVMDETMRRLEGVATLPALVNSLEKFSVSLGSELVALLKEYDQVALCYSTVHLSLYSVDSVASLNSHSKPHMVQINSEQRSPTGGSCVSIEGSLTDHHRLEPLEVEMDVSEDSLKVLAGRLKHTIKCILRALNKNPSSVSVMKASQAGGHAPLRGTVLLRESINDFRDVLNVKLLMSRAEEKNIDIHMKEVKERQKQAEQLITKLEAELEQAQHQRNIEVTQKNDEITRLKNNIKTAINLAADANRRVRIGAESQKSSNQSAFKTKKEELEKTISTLSKKHQDLLSEHREKEQELRKRAFKRETELENWIQKYDSEMGEKQDELEQLETEYSEETKQLKELEEKLGILTLEYDVVIKEQEETRKRTEEADRRFRDMTHAARIIQRAWKKFIEHKKQLRALKKGKKGKGKGKAKGKGKGKAKKR